MALAPDDFQFAKFTVRRTRHGVELQHLNGDQQQWMLLRVAEAEAFAALVSAVAKMPTPVEPSPALQD